jgi:hypothetical protein
MQCPQCHYLRSTRDVGPDDTCPRCGILYAKFDPAVAARREDLRKLGEQRLYREARVESARINAEEHARACAVHYDWVGKLLRGLVVSGLSIAVGIFVASFIAGLLGVAFLPDSKIINIFIVGGR